MAELEKMVARALAQCNALVEGLAAGDVVEDDYTDTVKDLAAQLKCVQTRVEEDGIYQAFVDMKYEIMRSTLHDVFYITPAIPPEHAEKWFVTRSELWATLRELFLAGVKCFSVDMPAAWAEKATRYGVLEALCIYLSILKQKSDTV